LPSAGMEKKGNGQSRVLAYTARSRPDEGGGGSSGVGLSSGKKKGKSSGLSRASLAELPEERGREKKKKKVAQAIATLACRQERRSDFT